MIYKLEVNSKFIFSMLFGQGFADLFGLWIGLAMKISAFYGCFRAAVKSCSIKL